MRTALRARFARPRAVIRGLWRAAPQQVARHVKRPRHEQGGDEQGYPPVDHRRPEDHADADDRGDPPGEFPAPARKEAEHDEGQPGEPEAFHRGQRVGEGVRHPFPDGHGRDDADQQRADDPGAPAAGGCGSWRIHSGFPIWIHISSDQWNRLG